MGVPENAAVEQATFGVFAPVLEAWRDALVHQKGDQLIEASASLLAYLRASEEDRQECRELVDRIRRGLTTVEQAMAGRPGLAARVAALEAAIGTATGDPTAGAATDLSERLQDGLTHAAANDERGLKRSHKPPRVLRPSGEKSRKKQRR